MCVLMNAHSAIGFLSAAELPINEWSEAQPLPGLSKPRIRLSPDDRSSANRRKV